MKISDPAATSNVAAAVTDAPLPPLDQQFTAWVDGQLHDEDLARFELEMENFPEFLAERDSALHLGQMLRDHAAPPPLSNPEFFTHRLLQRLADEDEQPTPSEAAATTRPGMPPWLRRILLPVTALVACAQLLLLASYFLAPAPRSGPSTAAATAPAPMPVRAPAPAPEPSRIALAVNFYNTQATTPDFSAIPVHSAKGNMTVLWLNGLDWIPPETEIK